MTVLQALIGFVIAAGTLLDVSSTVLVPGPGFGDRSLGAFVRRLTLPLWRHMTQSGRRRASLTNVYAPLLLVLVFLSWLLLLLFGFGLMIHAAAVFFHPPLPDFSTALYVAGSSILTLGISEVDAQSFARCLVLTAALSGFSVVTATITFILQIQAALQERETGVLTLADMIGSPASAITLLETVGQLGIAAELPEFFRFWRDWSASLLHSHVAYPILGYFHSVEADSDWLTALFVVLDAAAIVSMLPDEPARGMATLMNRSGLRAVARLSELYGVGAATAPAVEPELLQLIAMRLTRAGFSKLHPDALSGFAVIRTGYADRLVAIAGHFGVRTPDLLPGAQPSTPS